MASRTAFLPSAYTPEGAFLYLIAVVVLALVAAVVYLVVFAGMAVPG